MSRTLKRPMFRKGGEVMEGIMTGIKPRKMFSLGSLSEEDQAIVGDVRRKMNLINAVGGGSGLSDPLTQFLLTAGPDLVAGKAAGGSKLEEIIGGVKPGIDQAIKTQQLKDLSNRKLATALISKSKGTDIDMIKRNALALSKLKKIPYEEALKMEINKNYYKKGTSAEEQAYQKGKRIEDDLGKYKDFLRNPEYNPLQKNRVKTAIGKININKKIDNIMDTSNPFISLDDYTAGAPREINNQKVRTLIPNDKDDFRPNRAYFMVDENAFFVYNADAGVLVELPGV
tara:strand:- start:729 stop:1583 length:855 start_codon:yes stop_codon:yes gene_type:complete